MTEPLDDANDAEHETQIAEAQQRDDDPEGDPHAEDPGAAEKPSDVDPEPQLNDDAGEDLNGIPEGDDDDDDLDGDDE